MGIKIVKKQDPTREDVGLTLDDLASFLDETARAGIPADTLLTDSLSTIRGRLKRVAVEYDG